MPRQNEGRVLAHEAHLAARIRRERERRGWSLGQLAERMGTAGCPINPSSLHRIETPPDPKRRRTIGVNELMALALVFRTSPEDLLLPMDDLNKREAHEHVEKVTSALDHFRDAGNDLWAATSDMTEWGGLGGEETREFAEYAHNLVRHQVESWMPDQDPGSGAAQRDAILRDAAANLVLSGATEAYAKHHPDEVAQVKDELFGGSNDGRD